MSSQSDIELLRASIGENFEFTPATNTLSDAVPDRIETDETAPDLSQLKRERLGASNCLRTTSDSVSEEKSGAEGSDQTDAQYRVYFKRPLQQSDTTETFAPKPVVVSNTGKITERG